MKAKDVPSAGDIEQLAHDSFDALAKAGTLRSYANKAHTLAHDLRKEYDGDREQVAEALREHAANFTSGESFLYYFILDHLADEIENGGDE